MELKKLFSFKGRIGRAEYWMTFVFIQTVLSLITTLAVLAQVDGPQHLSGLLWATGVPTVLASLTMCVKRLHDNEKSGWWLAPIFLAIPGISWKLFEVYAETDRLIAMLLAILSFGVLMTIVLSFIGGLPSSAGSNKYGNKDSGSLLSRAGR